MPSHAARSFEQSSSARLRQSSFTEVVARLIRACYRHLSRSTRSTLRRNRLGRSIESVRCSSCQAQCMRIFLRYPLEEATMSSSRESFEVVVIGGGIAGNALATVLARAGKAVLVLERSTVYRDRVRGELFQPWGVAEARRLGLHEVL